MFYVTFVISACICPTAMIFLLFREVFRSSKFIPTIAVCVTFTRDLETKGHVMVYVTYVISACSCPTAMIFVLFRKVFESRECILTTANCVIFTFYRENRRSRHGLRDVLFYQVVKSRRP